MDISSANCHVFCSRFDRFWLFIQFIIKSFIPIASACTPTFLTPMKQSYVRAAVPLLFSLCCQPDGLLNSTSLAGESAKGEVAPPLPLWLTLFPPFGEWSTAGCFFSFATALSTATLQSLRESPCTPTFQGPEKLLGKSPCTPTFQGPEKLLGKSPRTPTFQGPENLLGISPCTPTFQGLEELLKDIILLRDILQHSHWLDKNTYPIA